MALPNLTGQKIQDTYKRVLTVGDDGFMYDGTGSLYTPVSASHEITTELSASHANTADRLGGLNTPITELNYLNGISFAQGTYVKLMNQSVATTSTPSFGQMYLTSLNAEDGYPTLHLPTDATANNPHIASSRVSGVTPSIFLGNRGDNIITFVTENGDEAATIDQLGKFHGIVNGGSF